MPFVHNFSGLLIAIIIPICLIFVQYVHVHAYTCYAFKKKNIKKWWNLMAYYYIVLFTMLLPFYIYFRFVRKLKSLGKFIKYFVTDNSLSIYTAYIQHDMLYILDLTL